MSTRTTMRGNGMPGGRIQYAGDLTPPTSSYASGFNSSSLATRMTIAATQVGTGAPVVHRKSRRGGILSFVSMGGRQMRQPVPAQAAYGNVQSSPFQPINVGLVAWQINPSWHEAGYPRNLGLSQRTPQPRTNVTGAPGRSRMQPAPLFTRVQQVPRARANIRVYNTQGRGVVR